MAVAGLVGVSGALAQSSLSVFGVVDMGMTAYESTSRNALGATTKASRRVLSSNGYNSSRLGFRGTEDLGGGLAAGYWLEASLFPDDGTIGANVANAGPSVIGMFNRRSTLSLSGPWGELRLGRDYTPSFWNDATFDPFGITGLGANLISTSNNFSTSGAALHGFRTNNTYVRASNSVGYFLPPDMGGFYGQLMYSLHEQDKFNPGTRTPTAANNSRTGRHLGARFGYANGPLDIAAAYGESTVADAYHAGTTSKIGMFSVGATYDFKAVKLFGEYSSAKSKVEQSGAVASRQPSPHTTGYLIGAAAPIGPGLIRLSYSHVTLHADPLTRMSGNPKAGKLAVGYVHNLSKRTALYVTYASIRNRNGYDLSVGGSPAFATTGGFQARRSSGYDFGIRHGF